MREIAITMYEGETKLSKLYILRTLFHIAASSICYGVNLYGVYVAITISDELLKIQLLNDMYKFTPLFLTNWNYMFQTFFLSLSLLYDVLQWLDKHESALGQKLRYYRDIIFSGMVVPFTLFISTMFWTVYLIDRELVFPEVYDQVVPWWFNHCVHTNITIVVLIETLLQSRRYPANKKVELGLVTFIGVLYAVVYYTIYFLTHRWLYAVFGVMTWWQVVLYQFLIWGSTFAFYFVQFPVNRIFHGDKKEGVKDFGNGTREIQQ